MSGFRLLIVAASFAALVLPAEAQAADHPSCAPWKAQWAGVSGGGDLAAMDGVIGNIPGLCPALKAEAATRRADAVQQQAANEAARRANDPCQQARNDWEYAKSAGEETVRAYRAGVPAQCTMWRAEADARIRTLAEQKVAAEQARVAAERARVAQEAEQKRLAAERIVTLTAAAKAAGIEGWWRSVDSEKDKVFPLSCGTSAGTINVRVEDGQIHVLMRQGGNEDWKASYVVAAASGAAVETDFQSAGGNLVLKDRYTRTNVTRNGAEIPVLFSEMIKKDGSNYNPPAEWWRCN